MKKLLKLLPVILLTVAFTQIAKAQDKLPKLLIRLDDIGMNHSVDMAAKEVAETGMPISVSIQFACPWYQEAVAILKNYPNVAIGVHLTLTNEWRYYRWGPVLGRTAVPSLVDSNGFFYQTGRSFTNGGYKLDEVEKELSAQIERALHSGIKITYIDPHMGVALSTPQLRAITEKLARKYHLGISTLSTVTYYHETYKELWGEPIDQKKPILLNYASHLNPNRPNLLVVHTATPGAEIDALYDVNSRLMRDKNGKSIMGLHREAELAAILSPEFKATIGKKFQLINYADLLKGRDLNILEAVDGK